VEIKTKQAGKKACYFAEAMAVTMMGMTVIGR
jgi:hypothetical protein